jgi:hypothetical protein
MPARAVTASAKRPPWLLPDLSAGRPLTAGPSLSSPTRLSRLPSARRIATDAVADASAGGCGAASEAAATLRSSAEVDEEATARLSASEPLPARSRAIRSSRAARAGESVEERYFRQLQVAPMPPPP